MIDITIGQFFVLWNEDGQYWRGETLAEWQALPAEGIVLVDVYELKEWAPGKPYRWRMECEWFGCRVADNHLEFCRWHDPYVVPQSGDGWVWKRGVQISDLAMSEIRVLADPWPS